MSQFMGYYLRQIPWKKLFFFFFAISFHGSVLYFLLLLFKSFLQAAVVKLHPESTYIESLKK